ncbi:MAG: GNAT family N-acetyltransferase [Sphingomonas bacterium]
MSAPELCTARLRLRAYNMNDFRHFAEFYASSRSEFADGPVSRSTAWAWFAGGAGRWALVGYGAWALERLEDGASLGVVSLNYPTELHEERELGWLLWHGYEGLGYASEAAMAARQFAFEELGWENLVSYIHKDNASSVRLAERLSAHFDAEASAAIPDKDTLVYRHKRVVVVR